MSPLAAVAFLLVVAFVIGGACVVGTRAGQVLDEVARQAAERRPAGKHRAKVTP